MGVYDIVTPDNLTKSFEWREGRNFSAILRHNVLFFWTGHGEDSDDGITVELSGQFVKRIDEDTYVLEPSNITIQFVFQSIVLKLPGISITQAVMGADEDESDAKLDELRTFLDSLLVKQTGREVGLISQLEMPVILNRGSTGNTKAKTLRRNVPYNAKGLISGFLTGRTGSLPAQTNALQQNLGTSLAPRPRKRKSRHTRHARHARKN